MNRRRIDAVAVVVPARNEVERIGTCLRSVVVALGAAAGGRRVEIVVVDDASDDGTSDVAAATLAGSATDSVILRADVGQAGAARIIGLRHVARGAGEPARTWVLCTDADCVVPPPGWADSSSTPR